MSWRHKHQIDSASNEFKKNGNVFWSSEQSSEKISHDNFGRAGTPHIFPWLKLPENSQKKSSGQETSKVSQDRRLLRREVCEIFLGPKIKWRTNKRNKTGLNYFNFILYIHFGRIKQSLNNFCFFPEPSFGRRLRMQLFLKSILAS